MTELFDGVGIRQIPRETLRRLALRRATVHDLTADDIARLEVNFIRHKLTKYDTNLAAGLNLDDMRETAYQAISLVYPDLAEECARQYSEKTKRVLRPIFPDSGPTPQ